MGLGVFKELEKENQCGWSILNEMENQKMKLERSRARSLQGLVHYGQKLEREAFA